jgi:hypothetical protein
MGSYRTLKFNIFQTQKSGGSISVFRVAQRAVSFAVPNGLRLEDVSELQRVCDQIGNESELRPINRNSTLEPTNTPPTYLDINNETQCFIL